jgi:CheY-like chemotaxis protein
VEDDPDVRDSLALVLRQRGHEVVEASHGREALALLAASPPPTVILLDLMMPVMNGWQFLATLRERPDASVPIIVMTAQPDQGAELVGTVEAVLIKPLQLERLFATIAHATEVPRPIGPEGSAPRELAIGTGSMVPLRPIDDDTV